MNCKLLLFSALTVFFATNVNAQIKKGSIFLGGSLSFGTDKTDSPGPNISPSKSNTFGISPAIGKAVRDNLILGIEGYFNSRESTSYAGTPNNEKTAGGAFFVRKYATLGKGFYLFGHGSLGGGWSRSSSYNGMTVIRMNGYNATLNIYPGVAYSVTNRLQLELGMPSLFSAYYYNQDQGAGVRRKGFNVYSSISSFSEFNVGVRVLLNKTVS